MLIIYSPLQWRNMSTGPQQRSVHTDICSVSGAAVEIPPKARLHSCCSMEDVMDMALTARLTLRPEEGQETVGCCSTEVVPGTFPHAPESSSFKLVCGWSVCLHHFTPAREEERERGVTVEVGENFSEGIHCPLSRENSINYLRWQMFTDPNMHEFVELAGFPQPNVLVFTMHAGAVVILAVVQRALI